MQAKCITVYYEHGSSMVTSGHKNNTFGMDSQYAHRKGKVLKDLGFGMALEMRPSKLILEVELDGERHEIWLHWYFRQKIGRLTEKRRDAVIKKRPRTIEVEERTGQKGTKYFVATDVDLDAWMQRVSPLI